MTLRNARCNEKDSPSIVCFVRYNRVTTWRYNLLVSGMLSQGGLEGAVFESHCGRIMQIRRKSFVKNASSNRMRFSTLSACVLCMSYCLGSPWQPSFQAIK